MIPIGQHHTPSRAVGRLLCNAIIALLCAPLLEFEPAGAQADTDPTYTDSADRLVRVTTADGLPTNRTFSIYQDDDGLMWFGTFAGLSRYDGVNVDTFERDPARSDTIADNAVLAVVGDTRYIWAGTGSGKVSRLDRTTEKFVTFDAELGPVSSLLRTSQDLWVGTIEGLARMDPKSGRTTPVPIKSAVADMAVGPDGELWVATSDGLHRYEPESGKTRVFVAENDDGTTKAKEITGVKVANDGTVWFGTDRFGLQGIRPDGTRTTFARFEGEEFDYYVYALEIDSAGDLWTNSGDRLYRIDPETGSTVRFAPYPTDPGSMAPGATSDLFADRDGDIWVAKQDAGIGRLDPSPNLARILRVPASSPDATVKNRIHSIAAITAEGRELVAATTRSSPTLFDLAHNTTKDLDGPEFQDCNVLTSKSSTPTVWCLGDSVRTHNFETGTTEVLIPEGFGAAVGDAPRAAASDGGSGVWVAGQAGLFHVDENGQIIESFSSEELGLADGTSTIAVSGDRVVAGHWGLGLAVIDLTSTSIVTITGEGNTAGGPAVSDPTILDVAIAADGSVLAATNAGLDRFSADLKSVDRYNPSTSAMPSGGLSGLILAYDNIAWVGSPVGITAIDLETGRATNFTSEDGLISGAFEPDAFLLTPSGVAVAGGSGGINTFDPTKTNREDCDRPATLQNVEVDGHDVARTASLDLESGARIVALRFRQLCFANRSLAQLRYRFKGESDWALSERGSFDLVLPSLGDGSHRIQVQASDRAGGWVSTTSELTITMHPPWYRNRVLQVGAVVVLLAFGIGAAALRGRAARHRQRELEREVAAQTEHLQQKSNQLQRAVEEQQDLLDIVAHDIRAPVLRQMINLGMVGSKPIVVDPLVLQREVEVMDRLLRRLMRSRELEGEREMKLVAVDLAGVITACLEQNASAMAAKGLTVSLSSATASLARADRDCIEEVVENAVDNAIKYSQPGEAITVRVFSPDDVTVAFSVTDTGVGIDPSEMSRLFTRFGRASQRPTANEESVGLGLFAVERLVSQMHGSVAMTSPGVGQGATLTCTLPRWQNGHPPNGRRPDLLSNST